MKTISGIIQTDKNLRFGMAVYEKQSKSRNVDFFECHNFSVEILRVFA